jgi:glycosidase
VLPISIFPAVGPKIKTMPSRPQAALPNSATSSPTFNRFLRLRSEHDALRNGKLWDLLSSDSSLVFLRVSDEERLLVAFEAGANSKTVTLSLQDTPAAEASATSSLFGNAEADLAGRQLRLTLPPQSLSIFSLE